MSTRELNILSQGLFDDYKQQVSEDSLNAYLLLKDSELSADNFSFYTSVSAVFSSKIEGENIELDSYIKHKKYAVEFQPDYTQKIDDLYDAYQFAKNSICNEENITKAHKIITSHILPGHSQGQYRTGNMYVTSDDGKIEYVAVSPFKVKEELDKFHTDLKTLQEADLSIQEVFYFAALLHLVFVKIHPFDDGNGRTGRLIEKWFLANKLGEQAWLIPSEKNYYNNHQIYYNNIRVLGLEYDTLDYSKSLPFLSMLSNSI